MGGFWRFESSGSSICFRGRDAGFLVLRGMEMCILAGLFFSLGRKYQSCYTTSLDWSRGRLFAPFCCVIPRDDKGIDYVA